MQFSSSASNYEGFPCAPLNLAPHFAGDQDLFKYVLEYHRDRKIILPPTVSKEAVLRELKRFGLDLKPEENLGRLLWLDDCFGFLKNLKDKNRESDC